MHACREGSGMNIGKSIRADSLSALNTYSMYTGQGTEKKYPIFAFNIFRVLTGKQTTEPKLAVKVLGYKSLTPSLKRKLALKQGSKVSILSLPVSNYRIYMTLYALDSFVI